MIRVICFLLLINSSALPQVNTFLKLYNKYSSCGSIDKNRDGGFAAAGINYTSQFNLIRLDSIGEILWEGELLNYFYASKIMIKDSPDSTFLISYSNSENSSCIKKVRYSGEDVWQKIISEYFIKSISTNADGSILAAFDDYNSHLLLVKYSADGDTIWTKNFLTTSSSHLYEHFVIQNDSSIYFAANKTLYRLDLNGNITHTFSYGYRIMGLTISQDNLFVTTGLTFYKYDMMNNLLLQFNSSLTAIEYVKGSDIIAALRNYPYNELYKVTVQGVITDTLTLPGNIRYIGRVDDGITAGGMSFGMFLLKTDINLNYKSLLLISPGDNTLLASAEPQTVKYHASSINPPLSLQYSYNQGVTWETITASLPVDSVQSEFITPLMWSNDIKLRIHSSDMNSNITNVRIGYGGAYDYISVNKIKMWAGNNGDGSHNPNTAGSGFYWPFENNKTLIFEDGLIYGGKVNGQIRVNGNTHRQGLMPGKILPGGIPDDWLDVKYGIWKLKYNWNNLPPGIEKDKYQLVNIHWPVDMGAPFTDINQDGIYTPGDDIAGIGDETLFYAANDIASESTYGSPPIGLEFQTTIFGFSQENPLKDVVFKKYIIINKSMGNVEDFYLAYWADPDLGNSGDDVTGVDSLLDLAYCYNYSNIDQILGSPVPAVGHKLIHGPIVPGSSTDTAMFKGKWIKGYRNLKSTSFITYGNGEILLNITEPQQGDYNGTLSFYKYLQGLDNEGMSIINPVAGEPTKFMFNGDPYRGTGWYNNPGGWPGGPIGGGDRRYLLSTGPINMAPGDTQEVVIAIAAAIGTDYKHSIEVLKNTMGAADSYYKTLFTSISGVNDNAVPMDYSLSQNYPNPFNNSTVINFTLPSAAFVNLTVYNITGEKIADLISKEMEAGNHKVNFSTNRLASGIYFYRLTANDKTFVRKMMLVK